MTTHFKKIGVIGAGAWGTAIAQMLSREGQSVLLWALEPEVEEAINARHENTVFLPGVPLNPALRATTHLGDLAGFDALFCVTPAQHTRATLTRLEGWFKPHAPVVLCSKGIELATGKFMTEVLTEELPDAVPAVMSGPSFAIDVAKGLPTAVTLAIEDAALGAELIQAISTPTFRPYLGTDLLGAEIGGAEMTRLALAMGAEAETLTGLSGLGDLVLTCSSETSRNMSLGLALGEGKSLAEVLGARHSVTEGVATAPVLRQLARARGIEMPISEAVAAVVEGEISVDEAILALLMRPVRAESVKA
jgi:glycerol-3-phosphate dehydrogenase (NAD(P)+)